MAGWMEGWMVVRGRRGNGWYAACPTGRMGKRGSIGWLDGWMFDVTDAQIEWLERGHCRLDGSMHGCCMWMDDRKGCLDHGVGQLDGWVGGRIDARMGA